MRIPEPRAIGVALLAILLGGCAATTAPKGWLPTADEGQKEGHGGWISVRLSGSQRFGHSGELLAIHADSVFILQREACVGVARAGVAEATLMGYDAEKGTLATWTLLGTISTLSHGVGLLISAPVWIIAGAVETGAQSRAPQVVVPPKSWENMRVYARFPQGLPEGLDRSSLRAR